MSDEITENMPVSSEVEAPASPKQVDFYVLDKNGEVLRSGTCNEELFSLQAWGEGETVKEGIPPTITVDIPLYPHSIVRAKRYPTLTDQIGVLWKIIEKMGQLHPELMREVFDEEALDMMAQIQSVKTEIPKNVMYTDNLDDTTGENPYIQIN